MTREEWKQKNLDDAVIYAEQWRQLIPTAVNPQSRLIAEEFYRQALAEVERIRVMDYSQFECVPSFVLG